jgi:hypothetical protein
VAAVSIQRALSCGLTVAKQHLCMDSYRISEPPPAPCPAALPPPRCWTR